MAESDPKTPTIGFHIEDADTNSEEVEVEEGIHSTNPAEIVDEVDSKKFTKNKEPMKPRSAAWEHFTKYTDKFGKMRGQCIHCGATYACDTTGNGTSNLNKHYLKCLKNPSNVASKPKSVQPELCFQPLVSGEGEHEPVGQLSTWKFDQKIGREALARWIVSDELPFTLVESKAYRKKMSVFCPRFKFPSRWTSTRDFGQLYSLEKLKLKNYLKNHGQRISFTTDTWTSVQRINYMCLTAHFIDDNWKLQKKVLNFCEIESHKDHQIGLTIENCLLEWEINKVFAITVDNASSNDVAISYLKKKVMNWGDAVSCCEYMHVRCTAHIVNLIVQDGLKEVGPSVKRVRAAIKYIRASPARLKMFKECVLKEKILCKKSLSCDCPTRWNSTYEMLSTVEQFERAFDRYESQDVNYRPNLFDAQDEDAGVPISNDWNIVRKICAMLKLFYNLTMRISGTKYVTSNTLWAEVSGVLSAVMYWIRGNDEQLKGIAFKMKQKFDKYWMDPKKINKIIWFAVVFDPREKFEIISISFNDIYGIEDGPLIFNHVKESFTLLFKEYQKMHEPQEATDNSSNSSQQRIENSSVIEKSFSSYEPPTSSYYEVLKKQRGDGNRPKRSELDLYLDEALLIPTNGFDILNWWKLNSSRFPILSIMAQDILAVPVSTVASESTFSTSGRVLDPYRSSLSPQVVESLICTHDWIRETDRPLFTAENIEDVEKLDKEFELGIDKSSSVD